MGFNPNIPQSTSKRVISQKQILINFKSIFQAMAKNHSALGLGNQGRHTVLVLRDQTAAGDPATNINQIALYQKLVGGIPSLFFRPSINQTPIQLSYPSIDVTSAAAYTFVAGPFVVYMGKIVNPTNPQPVVLLPATTLRYVGVTTTNFKGTGLNINSVAATNIVGNTFNIRYKNEIGPTRDVYYLAIGN